MNHGEGGDVCQSSVVNVHTKLAHKMNEEVQVKAGRIKPGENISHSKGAEAAQLYPVVATCRNGGAVLLILSVYQFSVLSFAF